MPIPEEDTQMLEAIETRDKATVLRLLNSDNMSFNPKDEDGKSLLHLATRYQWNDVIEKVCLRMKEAVKRQKITEHNMKQEMDHRDKAGVSAMDVSKAHKKGNRHQRLLAQLTQRTLIKYGAENNQATIEDIEKARAEYDHPQRKEIAEAHELKSPPSHELYGSSSFQPLPSQGHESGIGGWNDVD